MEGRAIATASRTAEHTVPSVAHCLCVDDDPGVLQLHHRRLQQWVSVAPEGVTIHVHSASSCEEAVEIAGTIRDQGERIACAFLDFVLGDGPDGIDATLRLWEFDEDVQCTLVTGAENLGEAETLQRIPKRLRDRWDFVSKSAGSFALAQRVRRSLLTWFAHRSEEVRRRENRELFEELSRINTQLEATVEERTRALAERNDELQQQNGKLEEALRSLETAQSKLLHQEKMASIGQLAAGVAHELNNPIGFVHSNLETLERYTDRIETMFDAYEERVDDDEELRALKRKLKIDFLRADLPQLISESRDGTLRVRKIVEDLKTFSRPSKDDVEYNDLNVGLESTLTIVNNELKYRARVVTELGDIPRVRCWLGQINQVFMNVLVNAAQSIEKFGEIRISTAQDGDDVVVTISDTGRGMPPDVLARISEPFYTTKAAGKGTGLGLSISYDIVRKHGGTIQATSEVGNGTTFTIRLPIEGPEVADEEA